MSCRSVSSAPAFLFLSLALSGLKKRDGGSLFIPIGFRSGIMLASLLVHSIGFVNYKSSNPLWVASTQSRHPFDGIVGLSLCILLAIFLYPRQTHTAKEKIERNIKKQMGDTWFHFQMNPHPCIMIYKPLENHHNHSSKVIFWFTICVVPSTYCAQSVLYIYLLHLQRNHKSHRCR